MTQEEFQNNLQKIKNQIGTELFVCNTADTDCYKEIYDFIEEYAEKKQLFYTSYSLPLVRSIMCRYKSEEHLTTDGITRYRGHYLHALDVCKLLISMVLPVSAGEEDYILAAALCHVIPNVIHFSNPGEEMMTLYHLEPRICEIITLIISDGDLSSEGLSSFYQKIQENKLAMIVFLADRGKLVQQLNHMPIWSANRYIYETRSYLFPLCIYAKEHYPEFEHTINILRGKIKTITDACSILLKRYEMKEFELTQDILYLKEENATIRRILKELKAENK